jgi:hypothetical protein
MNVSDLEGLTILVSNYELENVEENEQELAVTTVAVVQPAETQKLLELGWHQFNERQFVYIKEVDVPLNLDADIIEED